MNGYSITQTGKGLGNHKWLFTSLKLSLNVVKLNLKIGARNVVV